MNTITAFILTLATLSMAGCASQSTREVSPDYTATGATEGISAYVRGNHTLIEFDEEPSLAWVAPPVISITDEDGRAVGYKKVGRFCRLDRKYDYFRLRVNGWLTAFFLNNHPMPTTATHPTEEINQQADPESEQNPNANLSPTGARDQGIF